MAAASLILTTGVRDHVPPVEDGWSRIRDGLIRQCPVCDAFELIDKHDAVIGAGNCAAGEALLLSHYTSHVMMVTLGKPLDLTKDVAHKLAKAGIQKDQAPRSFAAVYSGLGNHPQNVLARDLNLSLAPDGRILTDAHQETSVANVFAAGDVVTGLNQIAVAMAQGEIAATRVHNMLRPHEDRTLAERA